MYKNKYKMIMLIWIKNNYVRTVCINLTEHFKQSSAKHMYYYTSHRKAHYTPPCSSVKRSGVHSVPSNSRTTYHTVQHCLYMIMTPMIEFRLCISGITVGHREHPSTSPPLCQRCVRQWCQSEGGTLDAHFSQYVACYVTQSKFLL